MVVSNVEVYGLENSIKRAKYPKSVNIDELNSILKAIRKVDSVYEVNRKK